MNIKSQYAEGKLQTPVPVAQEVISVRVAVALLAAQVATGNVVEFLELPAGCVPVGYTLVSTDLDAATGVTIDLGLLTDAGTAVSTDAADGGAKWVAASALGQAGGILLHTASKAAYDIVGEVAGEDVNRTVGLVFAAGATTGADGTVTLELQYKAA